MTDPADEAVLLARHLSGRLTLLNQAIAALVAESPNEVRDKVLATITQFDQDAGKRLMKETEATPRATLDGIRLQADGLLNAINKRLI
ncbi:hypothetical protein DYQ94_06500 [Xanthomonas sp. LMG 8993]|uniref:hypothetical protein n=1 Tax=Xanthomonas TaxID=338 RepID=UPI00136F5ECB|nr:MULTISPECIES: hypothetical protein [Xanthomonas]MBB4768637.1 hypothetical protein [Xanthomonas arboricola]MXV46565.1 hypothetical protein [Xanthomonas sp. LMG 8993]